MPEETPRWKIVAVVGFYMAVALIMVMTASLDLPSAPAAHSGSPPAYLVSTAQRTVYDPTVDKEDLHSDGPSMPCQRMARGLVLPMTVFLQSVSSGVNPTMATIGCCGLVTWGFTYSILPSPFSDSNTSISYEAPLLGIIFGVASAATIAIHAVLIKTALKIIDGNTMDLAYWTNALSALSLLPCVVLSGELPGIGRLLGGQEGNLQAFIIGSTLTVRSCLRDEANVRGSLDF
ncbi:hypothetical protein P7C73_g1639, partial [Tremellales sp. Uapishka_1]